MLPAKPDRGQSSMHLAEARIGSETAQEDGNMKPPSNLLCLFLLASAPLALAQRVHSRGQDLEPPALQKALVETDNPANTTIAAIVAVAPEIPRGPLDLLRDYRDQMTLTAQTLSAELAAISVAVRNGRITRAEAEYLIQQRAQLAAMQYEVFSALYDSLAFEIAQATAAAARPRTPSQSDSTVVVQIPWSRTATQTPPD
jgi:hypothetical protein